MATFFAALVALFGSFAPASGGVASGYMHTDSGGVASGIVTSILLSGGVASG